VFTYAVKNYEDMRSKWVMELCAITNRHSKQLCHIRRRFSGQMSVDFSASDVEGST